MAPLPNMQDASANKIPLLVLVGGCSLAIAILPKGIDFLACAAAIVAAVFMAGSERLPPMPAGQTGKLIWFVVAGLLAVVGIVVLNRAG